jgi:ADP-ribose pyrophosphatase YjhB (NUDIX family)
MNHPDKITIRIYGLVVRYKTEILLTDEFRLGMRMTKFPGGGLEPGEGTIDCLRREFREEMEQEIKNIRHFYTTDFFQQTRLLPEPHQIISIYYLADLLHPEKITTTTKKFDFDDVDGAQTFRWEKITDLKSEDFTFPIDKVVLEMLQGGDENSKNKETAE